jgi:hypothetical protein
VRTLVQVLPAFAGLALVAAVLPAGYALRWLTFTYGAGGLDPARRRRVAVESAGLVGAGLAFDGLVRWPALRALESGLRGSGGVLPAALATLLVTAACGLLIALVSWRGRLASDSLGAGTAVLHETLFQGACTLLLAASGSWVASGLLNGGSAALRLRVMGDATGPWETLFFFASSTPRLKWLLLATPVGAGLLAFALSQLAGAPAP